MALRILLIGRCFLLVSNDQFADYKFFIDTGQAYCIFSRLEIKCIRINFISCRIFKIGRHPSPVRILDLGRPDLISLIILIRLAFICVHSVKRYCICTVERYRSIDLHFRLNRNSAVIFIGCRIVLSENVIIPGLANVHRILHISLLWNLQRIRFVIIRTNATSLGHITAV